VVCLTMFLVAQTI